MGSKDFHDLIQDILNNLTKKDDYGYCGKCGSEIQIVDIYCPDCGHEVDHKGIILGNIQTEKEDIFFTVLQLKEILPEPLIQVFIKELNKISQQYIGRDIE